MANWLRRKVREKTAEELYSIATSTASSLHYELWHKNAKHVQDGMPRPTSDLGIVIDRSNTAAQTGLGFDSSRDVSLRCFDRCH